MPTVTAGGGALADEPTEQLTGLVEAQTAEDLARLLRQLRRRDARRRGDSPLTYRELAAKTGWSHGAVGQYFSGAVLPSTDKLDQLVRLLGASKIEQGKLATARDRIEERRRDGPGSRLVMGGPAAAGTPASAPRQLPPDVSVFAGRERFLADLDRVLGEAGVRTTAVVISAISGTAGVGKTALAVHWAHRVADRFPDGQFYVNLRGFDPDGRAMLPAEAIRGFLDALGVPAERIPLDQEAQAGLYRSLVADRRVLIVLDNARDAEQVRPLLPGTPTALVVVTSRSQLSPLVAAVGAHPLALDVLTPDEARQLLAGRLGVERVAAEPDAVAQIITACAGLPLALAIAAARAQQTGFPLATVAAELDKSDQRLDALDAGDRTSQVRAAFSWSYAALTPHAAQLFRLLGLHFGPDLSTSAAASLAGRPLPEARRLLLELTRANLLTEHQPGRYTAHDLLRVYATDLTEHVDPASRRRAAITRLLDYYVHTAYAAARLLHPRRDPIAIPLDQPAAGAVTERLTDVPQALAWLTAERTVILAALRHATDTGYETHAWQLAWSLTTYLDRQGHWHDTVAAWRTAVQVAGRLGNRAAQAFAHRSLGTAGTRVGLDSVSQVHLRHALDLYVASGDLVGQAYIHRNLGYLCERRGRPDEALHHGKQALELYRASGHLRGQANALNVLGWYHAQLGNYTEALAHCEQGLTLFRELDDRDGLANTWDSLGFAHHNLGHHTEAVECYEQSLALDRELGDRSSEAATLERLGDTYLATGDQAAADAAWRHSLRLLVELDHPNAETVRAKLVR